MLLHLWRSWGRRCPPARPEAASAGPRRSSPGWSASEGGRKCVILLVLVGVAVVSAQAPPHLPPLDRVLPARAEAVYAAVAPRVDGEAAMDTVTLHGAALAARGQPRVRVVPAVHRGSPRGGWVRARDTSRSRTTGWPGSRCAARCDWAAPRERSCLSREADRVALAINSFGTPPGGLTARLVDAGRGVDASDYAGVDVKGAVVLVERTDRRWRGGRP